MTTRLTFCVLAGVIGIALVLLSGCYTQLSTMKEDRWSDDQYTYSDQQPQADTSYQGEEQNEGYQNGSECYDDWYYQHPRIGFSYYYPSAFWPSAAFSLAYADPWFYDYNWAYDPWYYSPYYAYPYYSYYRPYYYSNPWWSYYSSNGATVHRGSRDFGNTRTVGGGRVPTDVRNGVGMPAGGERGTTNLPTGARLGKAPDGGGAPGRTSSAATSNGRRTGNVNGTNRSSTGRSSGAVRGPTSRGGVTRGGTQGARPRPMYVPPPAQAPGHSNSPRYRPDSGTRNSGGSRGSGPTYSPPPSRAPSSSPPRSSPPPAPAPSGGGSRGGGSPRGGGHR